MGRRANKLLALLIVAAATAVLAAGCGGGSGTKSADTTPSVNRTAFSDYEMQMQQLGQSLGRTLASLGAANKSADTPTVVKDLKQVQKELRSTAAKLEAITPPPKITAQHALLRKGVLEYADELDGVITRYKAGDKQAAFRVADLKGVKDMQKATAAISKAGYVITG
jgi:hypothetical protein